MYLRIKNAGKQISLFVYWLVTNAQQKLLYHDEIQTLLKIEFCHG